MIRFFLSCSSHKVRRAPIDPRLVLKGQTLFPPLHNNNCRKLHFSLSVLFFVCVLFCCCFLFVKYQKTNGTTLEHLQGGFI